MSRLGSPTKRTAAGWSQNLTRNTNEASLQTAEHVDFDRIAKAIEALRDARAYMEAAPHDFGGHKAEAIRATDDAIKQLNQALAYRAREDREDRKK